MEIVGSWERAMLLLSTLPAAKKPLLLHHPYNFVNFLLETSINNVRLSGEGFADSVQRLTY